jgi:agmatinase
MHKEVHFNFGGLPLEGFEGSKVVILPAPYDLTTTYQPGTRRGPEAVISASRNLEYYDEELGMEIARIGIHTLPPLEPLQNPKEMICRVKQAIKAIIKAGKYPVMIGGEHSLSLGAVQAFHELGEIQSIVFLDAHADLRQSYQGTKYSHACVGRRLHELGLRQLLIGIRSLSEEEAEYLQKSNVIALFAPLQDTLEEALGKLEGPVYISLDLDVFDPGLMPAVGTPEPGGLGWYETLDILKAVATKGVAGFDVMELCPIPGMIAPDFLAAKLIYKLIGCFWA